MYQILERVFITLEIFMQYISKVSGKHKESDVKLEKK